MYKGPFKELKRSRYKDIRLLEYTGCEKECPCEYFAG